jgi:glycosyltransferase involved in cell wall biosynthesis
MSKVSVIIPNYNGARFLREAIDSALDQQDVDVEVIVVDDGSTDSSRGIIESYGDQIIAQYQVNRGAPSARNAGLAAATGSYIKFLDSDDYLLPDTLAAQVEQAQGLSSDQIVFGDAILVDSSGNTLKEAFYREFEEGFQMTGKTMILQSPLTSMPLYPVRALRAVGGFDLRMPAAQEYDLHLRLIFAGWRFIFHRTTSYAYRKHLSQNRISTQKQSRNSLECRFQGYRSHLDLAQAFYEGSVPQSVNAAFASVFWETGRFALRCDQSGIAKLYFEQARQLAADPFQSSSLGYRIACRLLGPSLAERIASGRREGAGLR